MRSRRMPPLAAGLAVIASLVSLGAVACGAPPAVPAPTQLPPTPTPTTTAAPAPAAPPTPAQPSSTLAPTLAPTPAPTPTATAAPPPATPTSRSPGVPAEASDVIVNGDRLSQATLQALEERYGLLIQDGAYWYDPVMGAWGRRGGPTVGFLMPGLRLGGPLRADASGGGTGVYLNGRELPVPDLLALEQVLGSILPARYWMDAQGFTGYENGPALANIIYLGNAAAPGGYIENTYGGYIGSDGQTTYFFDPESGCSVVPGGGVSC